MAKRQQRTLLFEAEGQTASDETRRFSVYEEGDAFYIVGQNMVGTGLYRHLCHASIKNQNDIKREIGLVFNVKITKIISPWEIQHPDVEDKDEPQT